jgi:hypothetical protein
MLPWRRLTMIARGSPDYPPVGRQGGGIPGYPPPGATRPCARGEEGVKIAFMTLRSLLLLSLCALALNSLVAMHLTGDFKIRVVDQRTGQGIPNVLVTSDTGIVCGTDKTGSVRWNESALMGRDVTFGIEKPGYSFAGDEATINSC